MKRQLTCEAVLGIALIAIATQISLHAELTEELHKTYLIDADGRVSLKNVNGAVHISAWDRNEVQVDAIKRARTKEALDEAEIVIDSASSSISIRTRYPDSERKRAWHGDDQKASVEYTLKVPRRARLFAVETVNGGVDVKAVSGNVKVSSVNGSVIAQNLASEAQLSTVNGRVEASFEKLEGTPSISLHTVNGSIELSIPDRSNAELSASTVHGGIASDFGMPASTMRHHKVGGSFTGRIGSGGAHIKLSSVNGGIRILSTADGRRVVHAD
jgi:DUF4097 and DUF4098 domain-containing protein YvlB